MSFCICVNVAFREAGAATVKTKKKMSIQYFGAASFCMYAQLQTFTFMQILMTSRTLWFDKE